MRRVEVTRLRGVARARRHRLYRLGVARFASEASGLPSPFERTVPSPLITALGAVAKLSPDSSGELRFGETCGPKEGSAGNTRLRVTRDGDDAHPGREFPNWRQFYGKSIKPPLAMRYPLEAEDHHLPAPFERTIAGEPAKALGSAALVRNGGQRG